MNAVNSMLLLEALVAVLLLCGLIAFLNAKRKQKDRAGVNHLLQTIGLHSDQHALQLEDQLARAEDVDQQAAKDLIKSAKSSEKALYQHIISLYLKRDASLLGQLGTKVNGLTDSYLNLMTLITPKTSTPPVDPESVIVLQMQLDQAIAEKRQLSKELKTVSSTLEDVSDEYAKMFGGTPAFDEIHASKVRMLRMIEKTIKELRPKDTNPKESTEAVPES